MADSTPSQTTLPVLVAELMDCHRALGKSLNGPSPDLLATEILVLAALTDRDTPTPSQLASLTGLSRGRMTHIIDRLVETDLVAREPDSEDKRRVILALTPEGKKVADEAAVRVRRLEEAIIEALGKAGVEMLSQQLTTVEKIARDKGSTHPELEASE